MDLALPIPSLSTLQILCNLLWARPEFVATWRRPVGPLCSSSETEKGHNKKYTFHTQWEKEFYLDRKWVHKSIFNEAASALSQKTFSEPFRNQNVIDPLAFLIMYPGLKAALVTVCFWYRKKKSNFLKLIEDSRRTVWSKDSVWTPWSHIKSIKWYKSNTTRCCPAPVV